MLQSSLDLIGIEKVASVDYLEKVMACYREGRVAVPRDAGTQLPAGYAFREMLSPAPGGGWFTRAQAPIHDASPAQVSFSSGTTGMPKAILLSHRALGDVTDRLIAAMEVDSDIREYLGVPPTYSFGLGRARVVAAVGGQLFVPARGFDPMEFARMLEAGEINALSAVPTLLRALMSIPDLLPRRAARQLRWLEIGSQPMSAEEKQTIRRIFPAARIIQHYGLTEASRTTFLDIQEASAEELETVGRPIGQTEIRIDAEDRICIRGPHVADGILTPDGLQPLVDNDGWLTTNDLGRIDERGFLTFLGRVDHLLNVGGIKVSAELFEQRLAERLGADAAHVAVAARADTLRGQTVMVTYLPALSAGELGQHARAVGASLGLSAPDVVLVEVPEIPRTDTGKVQRALLTERHGATAISTLAAVPPAEPAGAAAPAAAPAAAVSATGMNERERQIAAIWEEALGVSPIGRDESFFDIGGDSLSAITVMIRMERAGVPKALTQQIFEGRTIAQIAADAESTETIGVAPTETGGARGLRAVTTDAISMTRALLVMLVIVNHWSPFLFTRMGEAGNATFHSLVPLFRAGTPGFAIVFGLGLGYFQAPVARRTPERLAGWRRARVLIIGGSVLLLGLIRAADHYLGASGFGPTWPAQLFFGVLCFYLLMVATAPWWLRLIVRAPYPIGAALVIMSASYLLSGLFRYLWLDAQLSGLLDLGRLLLVTRYSYPEMLGHVMIGVTIGLWIGLNDERPDLPRVAAWGGLATFLGGLMLSLRGDTIHWFDDVATVPQALTYAGGALLVFSLAFAQARRTDHSRAGLRVMRLLVVIGLLALPAYVGHEGVAPLVDLLGNVGLGRVLATAIPVLAFAMAMLFAMQRVYRLYYRSAN
jgi:acyl-CoA synthetase (AMP-forming)/AMP-acid ligase II